MSLLDVSRSHSGLFSVLRRRCALERTSAAPLFASSDRLFEALQCVVTVPRFRLHQGRARRHLASRSLGWARQAGLTIPVVALLLLLLPRPHCGGIFLGRDRRRLRFFLPSRDCQPVKVHSISTRLLQRLPCQVLIMVLLSVKGLATVTGGDRLPVASTINVTARNSARGMPVSWAQLDAGRIR